MGEGERERRERQITWPILLAGRAVAWPGLPWELVLLLLQPVRISCRSCSTREGGHHHHHWVCWLARKCCRGCEGEREKLDNANSAQSLALAGQDWALPGLLWTPEPPVFLPKHGGNLVGILCEDSRGYFRGSQGEGDQRVRPTGRPER